VKLVIDDVEVDADDEDIKETLEELKGEFPQLFMVSEGGDESEGEGEGEGDAPAGRAPTPKPKPKAKAGGKSLTERAQSRLASRHPAVAERQAS
jgi:hypothetical protein